MLEEQEFAELKELLDDAEKCNRLSQFEDDFLESFRERIALYKQNTFVSANQLKVIERIKAKVYAT